MPNAKRPPAKLKLKSAPLGPDAWIDAAVQCMLRSSADGVRVERLATDLHVTKGSFYWHFRNREELLDAVLQHWKDETIRFNRLLNEGEPDPARRLMRFLNLPGEISATVPPADFDLAIRGWARRSEKVRQVTEEVDGLRHAVIARMFRELGATGLKAELLCALCQAIAGRLWWPIGLTAPLRRRLVEVSYSLLIDLVSSRRPIPEELSFLDERRGARAAKSLLAAAR